MRELYLVEWCTAKDAQGSLERQFGSQLVVPFGLSETMQMVMTSRNTFLVAVRWTEKNGDSRWLLVNCDVGRWNNIRELLEGILGKY